MKKNKLRLITSMLSISILGIIILQLYWLDKSIETQEKTFDQNVNHALRLVSDNIERNEFVTILNYVQDKQRISETLTRIEHVKDSLNMHTGRLHYNFTFNSIDSMPFMIGEDSFKVEIDKDETEVRVMTRKKHRKWKSLVEAEESLKRKKSDIDNEIFISGQEDLEIRAFVFDSLEIEKMYETGNDPDRTRMIKKRAFYDVVFNPILKNRKIEVHYVDSLLDLFLGEQGIDTDYAFRVKETDKITGSEKAVVLNRTGAKVDFNSELYEANLFIDENLERSNKIELIFPNKSSFIWLQTVPALALSLIFIAIVIWIFLMIIKSMMQQKKISEMKNDFINNMTHELKTPISTIALASEGILKNINGSNPKVTQYADIIYDENRRLSKQVEKILQISQLERDELKLDLSDVDIHELINEVLANFQVIIADRDANIRLELNADHHIVMCDRVHIRNIIVNLIDNALKYSPENPKIVIRTEFKNDELILTISDNGIGIPESSLIHIYDKFYRVPKGDIHDVKGFGLGLTYVKNICDSHQFDILVRSKLNVGTTFEIKMNNRHRMYEEENFDEIENSNG